jgi:hypothetical protein
MQEIIDAAIAKMAEKVAANAQPDAALKYSQAALNLAQVKQLLYVVEKPKRGGS